MTTTPVRVLPPRAPWSQARLVPDPATGVCVPFMYGGCDGNANNFPSLEACQTTCNGGEPNMDTCASVNDYVLVGAQCCGACDRETAFSFVSVNRGRTQDYAQNNRCGVSCGMCYPTPEGERTRQYFMPGCPTGHCIVVDVRKTGAVGCMQDADCQLRNGLGCCEECDGEGIVALSRFVSIENLVCPVPTPPCAPCPSAIPPSYAARCVDARCTVVLPP